MSAYYGLVLDALVIILLVTMIVYASVLNRRLNVLRNNRVELERATRSFAEAAVRADNAIKSLKKTADDKGQDLQTSIERAQELRDELSFLVDTAETLAQRMEGAAVGNGVSRAERAAERMERAAVKKAGEADDPTPARPTRKPKPSADRDILRAIENLR